MPFFPEDGHIKTFHFSFSLLVQNYENLHSIPTS